MWEELARDGTQMRLVAPDFPEHVPDDHHVDVECGAGRVFDRCRHRFIDEVPETLVPELAEARLAGADEVNGFSHRC